VNGPIYWQCFWTHHKLNLIAKNWRNYCLIQEALCVSKLTFLKSKSFTVFPTSQSPETDTNLTIRAKRIISCMLIVIPVIHKNKLNFQSSTFFLFFSDFWTKNWDIISDVILQKNASWDRGFESRWILLLVTLVFDLCVCVCVCLCLCCAGSGLCDELVTRWVDSYRVCLCLTVCDLGTSTNSQPSPQFGCSTTERE